MLKRGRDAARRRDHILGLDLEILRPGARLASTQWLRSRNSATTKASAKVGRCFRRLHAHGLVAKTPSTRRWRVTNAGLKVMGTTMYLRAHHFPNVYAAVVS